MVRQSLLIIGRKALLEALESGQALERIYLQNTVQADFLHKVRSLATVLGIPLRLVPLIKLNKFTRANHQGVVAMKAMVHYYSLQDLIDSDFFHGKIPLFLILMDITDVGNIGAIARSAYALGVTAMILLNFKGSMALGEDAVKSSVGALLKLKLVRDSSLTKVLETLKANGIMPFFTTVQREDLVALPPYKADLRQPLALIMGGEDRGIVKNYVGTYLHIPLSSGFDSLNVSVATGILLYEVCRQRDSIV